MEMNSLVQLNIELLLTFIQESRSKTDDNQSLWALAFQDLEKVNPELIEKFKYCMGFDNEADSVQNSESITKEIAQNAFVKINDLSKEAISGKSDKVRKYFEQTIKLVISTKDFISAAVVANPYAATAWTGVCLVLPVSGLNKTWFDNAERLCSYF